MSPADLDPSERAWRASHRSGMHWGCVAPDRCRVERLLDDLAAAGRAAGHRDEFVDGVAERAALAAGTHEPAVDDFGNQYLAPRAAGRGESRDTAWDEAVARDGMTRAIRDLLDKLDATRDALTAYGQHREGCEWLRELATAARDWTTTDYPLRPYTETVQDFERAVSPAVVLRLLDRLAALERVAEAAAALDQVATWSALGRPEVEPLRAALRALADGEPG